MGEPPVPGRTARVSRPFSVRRYWTGICGGMSGGGGGFDIGQAVSGDAAGLCHGDRPRSGFEPSPAPRLPLRTGEMPPWAQERSGHTSEDNENETEDAGSE